MLLGRSWLYRCTVMSTKTLLSSSMLLNMYHLLTYCSKYMEGSPNMVIYLPSKNPKHCQVLHLRLKHIIWMVWTFCSWSISCFVISNLISSHRPKIWCITLCEKPLRLLPYCEIFVRKSTWFLWLLIYAVCHSYLSAPSRTKCYTMLWLFFFKVEYGMVVFARTDCLSPSA